ncbi:MAG: hypothetical protein WC699_08275 [Bacteroidales bacterium]|jgi:hypothetical protein
MKKTNPIVMIGSALLLSVILLSSCKKNSAPVVASVVINPTAVDPGQTVSVTVTATDANNDPLTYAYTVNGGAISGTGPMVQWIAPSNSGAYSVSVVVSDGQGGTGMGNGALTVNTVQTFTGVSGTASFLAGTAGDLSNSKVSIYTSLDNWNNNSPIKFGAVTGSGASVTYRLSANPGNYYLDIWKDNDNNGFWTAGDFIGWYGSGGLGAPALTEIQLQQGQNFTNAVTMYIF